MAKRKQVAPAPAEHLIVDGYNLMYAWTETRRDLKDDIDGTRERFLNTVRVIHDIGGTRTTIVFDGQGAKPSFEYPGGKDTFTIVFSPSHLSADAIIEKLVAKSPEPTACTVATRDNLVTESIRASGAVVITPDGLLDWVERCERQQLSLLQERRRRERQTKDAASPWDALG